MNAQDNIDILKIELNTIRLRINEGPEFIEFNPDDILFIEGFYEMLEQFELKQAQYQDVLDKAGDRSSTLETIKAMKDICQYARTKIDDLFGMGSSTKLFGNLLAFSPIEQFFRGIVPYVKKARARRLKEFLPPQAQIERTNRKKNARKRKE